MQCDAKDAQEITFDYLEECLAKVRGNAGTPCPVNTIVKALAMSMKLNSQAKLGAISLRNGAQLPKTTENFSRHLGIS